MTAKQKLQAEKEIGLYKHALGIGTLKSQHDSLCGNIRRAHAKTMPKTKERKEYFKEIGMKKMQLRRKQLEYILKKLSGGGVILHHKIQN